MFNFQEASFRTAVRFGENVGQGSLRDPIVQFEDGFRLVECSSVSIRQFAPEKPHRIPRGHFDKERMYVFFFKMDAGIKQMTIPPLD